MAARDLISGTDHTVRQAAADLFVMTFPLLMMDAVKRAHRGEGGRFRIVPGDRAWLAPGLVEDDPRVVTSSAWIDLSGEPALLQFPHMSGRHFSLTILDSAGDCIVDLGPRTAGSSVHLALVGPHWHGEVRRGLRVKRSATDGCWAISRIHAHSMLDLPDTVAVASRARIVALDDEEDAAFDLLPARREVSDPVLDPPSTSCLSQVLTGRPEDFLQVLQSLLANAPATLHQAERRALTQLSALAAKQGVEALAAELQQGLEDGVAAIKTAAPSAYVERDHGWHVLRQPPPHGQLEPPLVRAARAYEGLGAPPAEDVLSFVCRHDEGGRVLSGENAYRLRLAEPAMPPVDGFWRLYVRPAAETYFRPGIGSRNDLALNADRSLDIIIQSTPVEASAISNWLPAPEAEMTLVLCLHAPRRAALNGAWRPPPVACLGPKGLREIISAGGPGEPRFSASSPAIRPNPSEKKVTQCDL